VRLSHDHAALRADRLSRTLRESLQPLVLDGRNRVALLLASFERPYGELAVLTTLGIPRNKILTLRLPDEAGRGPE
jgi:hypothetical protein